MKDDIKKISARLKKRKIIYNNKLQKIYQVHGNKKNRKICGTLHPITINSDIQELKDIYNENEIIKKKIKRKRLNTSEYSKLNIPVAFHVIYPNNKQNDFDYNIPDYKLDLQIDVLNGKYNPENDSEFTIEYGYKISQPGYQTNGNTSSGLTFYNYKVNGGAQTRTENSDWYYETEKNEDNMKSYLAINTTNIINIYITNADGYLGWSYFPSSYPENSYMHGPVISSYAIPEGNDIIYKYGRTLTHEIGHYFGLYHTFQDGCQNNDGCDDTPAQDNGDNIYECGELNTCNKQDEPGNDPVNNYMNYVDDLCMNHFTDDQFARIWSQLEVYKPNFIKLNSRYTIPINNNWNMISISENVSVDSLPSDMNSYINNSIYSYDTNNGYQIVDFIEPGKGYWMKFNNNSSIDFYITNNEIDNLFLNINVGWNLIGSLSQITRIESSNNIDIVYEYNNGTYIQIDPIILHPGKAYWLKSNDTITITLIKNHME